MSNEKNANEKMPELAEKLGNMSFYEKINFIRNGVQSVFGMFPKAFYSAIALMLDSLEADYKKCEAERNAFKLIAERKEPKEAPEAHQS